MGSYNNSTELLKLTRLYNQQKLYQNKMKSYTFAIAMIVLFGVIFSVNASDNGPCCYALNAKCLACQAGQTIAEYCAANHSNESLKDQVEGCENRVNGSCCYAMTAACLACNQGESVADYCKANPNTEGCQP